MDSEKPSYFVTCTQYLLMGLLTIAAVVAVMFALAGLVHAVALAYYVLGLVIGLIPAVIISVCRILIDIATNPSSPSLIFSSLLFFVLGGLTATLILYRLNRSKPCQVSVPPSPNGNSQPTPKRKKGKHK